MKPTMKVTITDLDGSVFEQFQIRFRPVAATPNIPEELAMIDLSAGIRVVLEHRFEVADMNEPFAEDEEGVDEAAHESRQMGSKGP